MTIGKRSLPCSNVGLPDVLFNVWVCAHWQLTLLWQDLLQDESNGAFDSHADMVVANPYHNRRDSITEYDRSQIISPLRFRDVGQQNSAWQLTRGTSTSATEVTGSIYLTSRLDGSSVADVWRMIDRGRAAAYRDVSDAIILDESPPGSLDEFGLFNGTAPGNLGADYNDTASTLGSQYPRLVFDQSTDFLTGAGAVTPGRHRGRSYPATSPCWPVMAAITTAAPMRRRTPDSSNRSLASWSMARS